MSEEQFNPEEEYKKDPIEFEIFPIGKKKKFGTLRALKNFVNEEYSFWFEVTNNNRSNQTVSNLSHSWGVFLNYLTEMMATQSKQIFDKNFAQFRYNNGNHILISKLSPEGQLISENVRNDISYCGSVYNYCAKKQIASNVMYSQFKGAADAYILDRNRNKKNKDDEYSTKSLEILEKSNLKLLDIDEQKDQYEEKINQHINNIESNFDEWNSKYESNFSELNDKFNSNEKDYKERITELETLYKEKLRLSAPAEYWTDLKKKYNKRGYWWIIGSAIWAVFFIVFLVIVFYNFPDWLKGEFKTSHVKGILIFSVIVSTAGYLLILFVKFATSSFHLAADATEREQLTHVYLAMLKDKNIEESERELVLQAIFSRAETGLIKGDGLPKMPTSAVLMELIKKIGK